MCLAEDQDLIDVEVSKLLYNAEEDDGHGVLEGFGCTGKFRGKFDESVRCVVCRKDGFVFVTIIPFNLGVPSISVEHWGNGCFV